MTENEILFLKDKMKTNMNFYFYDDVMKVFDEVLAYRKIGTVEELKEAKTLFDSIDSAVDSIVALGLCGYEDAKESILSLVKYSKSIKMTAHKAKEYMENEIRCIQRASYCDRDCAKCELVKEEQPLLEAFGVAIQALEKMETKSRVIKEGKYYCCTCGRYAEKSGYCNFCGQSLY